MLGVGVASGPHSAQPNPWTFAPATVPPPWIQAPQTSSFILPSSQSGRSLDVCLRADMSLLALCACAFAACAAFRALSGRYLRGKRETRLHCIYIGIHMQVSDQTARNSVMRISACTVCVKQTTCMRNVAQDRHKTVCTSILVLSIQQHLPTDRQSPRANHMAVAKKTSLRPCGSGKKLLPLHLLHSFFRRVAIVICLATLDAGDANSGSGY